jgi:peroxiredoxin
MASNDGAGPHASPRPLAVGDPLPDLSLLTAAGATVALGSLVRGRPAVLILMRHLGCLPCREHLFDVAARRAELGEARVLCVTFVEPPLLAAYERELALGGVEFYGDPARALYGALGFERASFARVWLHPAVWWRYGALIARGRRPHPPGQDVYQLGGDAVLDAGGRLRWVHASAGPEDRPAVDELLAALR